MLRSPALCWHVGLQEKIPKERGSYWLEGALKSTLNLRQISRRCILEMVMKVLMR